MWEALKVYFWLVLRDRPYCWPRKAVFLEKKLLSVYHLVYTGSDRPNVSFIIVLISSKNLRSHIKRRAQHSSCIIFTWKQLREAKISDFDVSIMQKYVCQFEVPMHDLMLDQRMESIQNLTKILNDILLWQNSLFSNFGEHVTAVAILEHQVVVVRSFLQSVQLYYVRIVASF